MRPTQFVPTIRTTCCRARSLLAWAIPAGLLVVVPKCPACFAAHAALWTGIGLSVPAAAGLRAALLVGCAGVLSILCVRLALRLLLPRQGRAAISTPRDCPACATPFVVGAEILSPGASQK